MRMLFKIGPFVACLFVYVSGTVSAHAEGEIGVSEVRITSAVDSEPTPEVEALPAVAFENVEALTEPTPVEEPTSAAEPKPLPRPTAPAPVRRAVKKPPQPMIEPPVTTNQMRQALNFYGGQQARATLSRFPTRSPIQAGPQQPMQKQLKPFHTIYRDPTVSPYLNLYREENDSEGAPNYFAFVRPELDQIEANRTQQREIEQLSRKSHGRGRATVPPQYQPAAASGRSTPARYRDTAQFYGGWSR